MKIEKNCLDCNKIFFVIPARKNTAKYCSKYCADKHTLRGVREKKYVEKQCLECGITFYVIPARKDKAKYCSKLCANKHVFVQNEKKEKTGIEKVCAYCGNKYYVFKCNVNKSKYCSNKCRCAAMVGRIPHNKKEKISCICEACGTEFYVSEYRKNTAVFCSKKCWYEYPHKNIKKKGVVKTCLQCNKEFYVPLVREKTAKFCSKRCYWKAPKSNEQINKMCVAKIKYVFNKYELEYWYLGLGWTVYKIAKYCDVKQEVIYWNLKKYNIVVRPVGYRNAGKPHNKEWNNKISLAHKGKVISVQQREQISSSISTLWKNAEYVRLQHISRNMSPNKLETRIMNILNKYFPNDFKFVGDFSFMVGSKCPDFINLRRRFILEIFGDYYHAGENPQERIKYFEDYGYRCVILWEHECNDEVYIRDSVLKVLSDYSIGRRDGWLLGKARIIKAVSEGV